MRTHRLAPVLVAVLLVACGGAVDEPTDEQTSPTIEGSGNAADDDLVGGSDDPAGGADDPTDADDPDVGPDDPGMVDDPADDIGDGPDGDDVGDGGGPDDFADSTDPDRPQVPALHPKVDPLDEIVLTIATADGTPVRVDAKIAGEHAERQHGLMEVEHLPDGTGMLFVFDEDRRGGFWMKNTLVPLDIAFSAQDGEILAIMTMEPCAADPCPSYNPQVAYRTALEVPAGWFEQMSVDVGDRLIWSDPVPAERA